MNRFFSSKNFTQYCTPCAHWHRVKFPLLTNKIDSNGFGKKSNRTISIWTSLQTGNMHTRYYPALLRKVSVFSCGVSGPTLCSKHWTTKRRCSFRLFANDYKSNAERIGGVQSKDANACGCGLESRIRGSVRIRGLFSGCELTAVRIQN